MDEGARSRIPRDDERTVAPNFVTAAVDRDLESGRVDRVVTRFPPEPNGYLHIGHAKAICLDFGVAEDYGGVTYLRLDDTNPIQEDPAFVEAIQRDVAWLGFQWIDVRHASDYFGRLYELARTLIRRGEAYVDGQDLDTIRATRGTVTTPGTPSPDRDRPPEESLALFDAMRRGEHPEGAYVLRAKIDMASPNMILRDPVLYRILHAAHHRTGDAWHVYPMYDFAHPLSDAIEGVTHSLCTLEFENNRAIYDWLVERLFDEPVPRQYEFNRLELDHTVVSKRKLAPLVEQGRVDGWDDPRLPTLAALRRRGVTPDAIRDFVNRIGVTKTNARTDLGLLEASIRDDLNAKAPRVMAVLDPVPLAIDGLDASDLGTRDAPLWPHDVPREGQRPLPLARDVWIERGDVTRDPPKGWKRFAPGAVVRLRHGPVVRCDRVDVDADGRVTAVHGTAVDPGADDVRVAGVVHWVAQGTAKPATFHLIDRLFATANPNDDDRPVAEKVDPGALEIRRGVVEPYVLDADPATRWQFERQGYFWRDPKAPDDGPPVFLRIVTLKDGWAKTKADAPAPRRAPRPA
ncbi:MAG: glutamine--tRNA ligase/YqeY domain fusion protein, partial [Trueperaceae bacterium]|nr:glutamine--tRNA ligase/YqeY domain fusion protein [Trueperaceae bacterium]